MQTQQDLEADRIIKQEQAETKAAQDRAKFDADDEYMFELWEEVNGH